MKNNNQEKVWAVFEIPTKQARIFTGAKPVRVSEPMTNKDAHDHCQHLNQCGYFDDLISGYDVKMIEKQAG